MKKILLLIILEILLCNSNIQAQIITQEQKDSIITDLYSTHWATVDYAKDGIIFYKIYEALPVLQSEIWNKNNYSRLSFVKAMFGLEFESTINYALALFDSLNENMNYEYDTIIIKLNLIEILFELNDFSKIYYLSYYTNPPYSEPYNFEIIKLWSYLLNVPEYTQIAKEKLQTLMSESTDETDRSLALFLLGKKYKEEISPLVIDRFSIESDFSIRATIASEYFPLGEAEVVSEILRSSLEVENNSSMQRMIINYLLDSLNTPANFHFIKNWFEGERSNLRVKKTINILIKYGNKGNPAIPSKISSVTEIIDSTESYLIQCNNYGWIGHTEFVNELQSIIQSAQSNLQAGDSVACAVQVKAFQDEVDFVYKDSLNADPRFVTLESWKFLYWNAQYILDRLPTPTVVTELELNEITPAMSMKNHPGAFTMELTGSGFNSNSVVYFNGNARVTTFISDSLLNAQILSADVSVVGSFPVWVSEGTINSDTLMFSVVNNLPNEILPIMNCVTNNGNGTYTAYFGYNNKNNVSVFIPVYAQNKISPDPWDRGQPGVFKVGIQERVFSVTWTSGNIIWHLNNKTAKAKTNSPPCP